MWCGYSPRRIQRLNTYTANDAYRWTRSCSRGASYRSNPIDGDPGWCQSATRWRSRSATTHCSLCTRRQPSSATDSAVQTRRAVEQSNMSRTIASLRQTRRLTEWMGCHIASSDLSALLSRFGWYCYRNDTAVQIQVSSALLSAEFVGSATSRTNANDINQLWVKHRCHQICSHIIVNRVTVCLLTTTLFRSLTTFLSFVNSAKSTNFVSVGLFAFPHDRFMYL